MTAPLHPRGTLQALVSGRPMDMFRKLGLGAQRCDLGDEGLYLAEELVEADRWLGGHDSTTLGVLVLALMIAQRQGSTRLPLDPKTLRPLVHEIVRVAGLDATQVTRLVRSIQELTGTAMFNAVIGSGNARRPLIVDQGCLYTERARWLEQRVAERLARRVAVPLRDPVARGASAQRPLSAEQERAVTLALASSIAVVTGGPGTGKTVVAAALVRGFAQLGIEHVALAAQTGKAANRLTQVIAEQLAATRAESPAGGAARPAPIAQTLHRLLGYGDDGLMHHAQSPLPIGALIVDEASMIDLEMMDALLDALPAHAPLILIGDANQLPAIDAGQILADLAAPEGAAAARVAVLEHSYRMDSGDPRGRAVLAAAAAVHTGSPARLFDRAQPLAVPRTAGTLTFSGVEWVDPSAAKRPHEATLAVCAAMWHHFDGARALRAADHVFRFRDGRVDAGEATELELLWQQLTRARILTVTRQMPTGAIAINAHLHDLALERLSVAGHPDFVPGEPIMITANDYQRGLFNGDQGIVVRADEGLGRHHYRAVFRCAGELRPFAIEALRDRLELAWALTVHKSQGSEYDAIALVLPHDDLPLVTRELVYTAITRARTAVTIAGSRMLVLAGAKRRALRHSGLADRLRAALGG